MCKAIRASAQTTFALLKQILLYSNKYFYIKEHSLRYLLVEMILMYDKVEFNKTFTEMAFKRFDMVTKDLSKKEIDWRPVEETNSIRWILTHLSQQWNVGIPRILKGDPEYKPEDWPEDYVGKESYSLEEIMSDLKKGRNTVLNGLEELTSVELEAESIPLWAGTMKIQVYLLAYLTEIFHHSGQIAYLRGAIERRKQTDEHFLT